MSQPVLLRSSVSIAAVRFLRIISPIVIVAVTLYAVSAVTPAPVTEQLLTLGTLAAILSMVAFRPGPNETPPLNFSFVEVAVDAALRWIAMLACLQLIRLVTGIGGDVPASLLLQLAAAAGTGVVLSHVLLMLAERGTVFAKENERTAVIVGVNTASLLLANRLRQSPEHLTRLIGFFDDRSVRRLEPTGDIPILGGIQDMVSYVKRNGIDIIFISLPLRHIQRVMTMIDDVRDSTASIYYIPDVFVFDLIQSRSLDVGGVPVIAMCETPFFGYRGVLKRMTDIGFTVVILLIALPVMILAALAVRLTSKGPVIFKQRRYGLDSKEIVVYKFRSMRVAEDDANVRQARKDDDRITTVGKFLRRTSIDELPQLFNVLQGRMSLVGPRPHAVVHNELYRRIIKGYMMRHKVLPGITGLAQVSGCRGETATLEQMQARVNYDLDYLRQWSPSLDLRILVRTALQMIRGDKQAY